MSTLTQVSPQERTREIVVAPIDYSLIFRNGMLHWMREAYLLARISGLEGIQEWQRSMETALHTGYEAAGAPRDSGPEGFLRYVVERDKALGIPAGGEILEREIVEGSTEAERVLSFGYWMVDPFLPLKERVPENEYKEISTNGYLRAKIRYFCPDFRPEMIRSTWKGDDRTEWFLRRNGHNGK